MQTRSNLGVGASEIAAANGISKYRSRYALWLEKTGRAPGFTGNVHTRLGQLCEPHARQMYANATGFDVITPPCSEFHPEIPWARATPDGRIATDPLHLVQIKCVGYFVGKRWHYEIPVDVLAQLQWEMFVTGAQRDDLAVLMGSDELEWERFILGEINDPREVFERATMEIFTIHRSDYDISILLKGATEFMDLVWNDQQPPIDDSAECRQFLSRKSGGTSTIALDDIESAALVDQWGDAYFAHKKAVAALETMKNRVRERMGNLGANRINTPAGPAIWSKRVDGTTQLRPPRGWSDWQESE